MARIRTIKPEFFTSEDIVDMTPLARLFYVSLWCESDREGRLEWKPKTFKLRYLPGDDCNIEKIAQELVEKELVLLYEVEGKKYAWLPSFTRHQVINNREKESSLPSYHDACATRESGDIAEGKEGREGKEGNDAPQARPPCPYQKIVETYHEVLPELPNVEILNDTRKKHLRSRWVTSEKTQSLDWWREYFAFVRQQPFLMGSNDRNWKADFDFLITESKFVKVVEGAYAKGGAQ